MYYLGFASEGTTKIAYAASCGKEEYSDEDWNKIRRLLGDFSAISLREKSSVKIFDKCCEKISTSLYCKSNKKAGAGIQNGYPVP